MKPRASSGASRGRGGWRGWILLGLGLALAALPGARLHAFPPPGGGGGGAAEYNIAILGQANSNACDMNAAGHVAGQFPGAGGSRAYF
jgi:hypothetical protein